jgi:hypothetical protein
MCSYVERHGSGWKAEAGCGHLLHRALSGDISGSKLCRAGEERLSVASGWRCSSWMLAGASESRFQPSLRPANAANPRSCTRKLPRRCMHHSHITVWPTVSQAARVSSVPSDCALSAQPLGHYVVSPPRGGRPRRRPASENPQVRPLSSNSGLTTPIGPIPTRACVSLSAHRYFRGRHAMGRRRRSDAPVPHGRYRRHCRPLQRLRRPPRSLERGAHRVQKIEPTHACTPRNCRERCPPKPPLPPRCPSPQSMSCTA